MHEKITNLTKKERRKQASDISLPVIPDKRYFTIGEVSYLCGVKPHVLRYWEQEFPQLRPAKRRGNRRYYQYDDIIMTRQIRSLLYEQGFTIEGARAQLISHTRNKTVQTDAMVRKIIADLEHVLQKLKV